MSEPPKNSRWELRLTLFFVGLLIGVLGATVVFVLLPRQYRPSTTLHIRSTIESTPGTSADFSQETHSDSINLKTQMEIIRSREILEPVITDFQLGQKWRTSPDKTFTRLRHATVVTEIRNTELTQISVLDSDPKLAAALTNAIGEQYQKMRVRDQGQLAMHLLDQLQAEVDDQREKTNLLQEQMLSQALDQLRSQTGDPQKAELVPEMKAKYIQAKRLQEAAEVKLATTKMMAAMPQAPVTIWERAEIPSVPASPRIHLLLLAGALAGIVLGAIMAALVRSTPS